MSHSLLVGPLWWSLYVAAAAVLSACHGSPVEATSDAPTTTFLYFRSDSGDWVGSGETHRFALTDGAWSVHTEGAADPTRINQVSFSVVRSDPHLWWSLSLAAVAGQTLSVGAYENAQRFNSLTLPNLDFGWASNGCNQVVGRFEVLYLEATGRTLNRLHATFEQHCEGAAPALHGEISYVRPGAPGAGGSP